MPFRLEVRCVVCLIAFVKEGPSRRAHTKPTISGLVLRYPIAYCRRRLLKKERRNINVSSVSTRINGFKKREKNGHTPSQPQSQNAIHSSITLKETTSKPGKIYIRKFSKWRRSTRRSDVFREIGSSLFSRRECAWRNDSAKGSRIVLQWELMASPVHQRRCRVFGFLAMT